MHHSCLLWTVTERIGISEKVSIKLNVRWALRITHLPYFRGCCVWTQGGYIATNTFGIPLRLALS